ncbi:hypothetical protein TB2_027962 [Malus domestica]
MTMMRAQNLMRRYILLSKLSTCVKTLIFDYAQSSKHSVFKKPLKHILQNLAASAVETQKQLELDFRNEEALSCSSIWAERTTRRSGYEVELLACYRVQMNDFSRKLEHSYEVFEYDPSSTYVV